MQSWLRSKGQIHEGTWPKGFVPEMQTWLGYDASGQRLWNMRYGEQDRQKSR
jgi:hypothetical protein